MKNVLITSAGRRVSFVKAFTNASKKLNLNSEIFTTDLNPKICSPASYFAKKSFKMGFFNDPNYLEDLLNICIVNKIKVIIPTIDSELELLASAKNRFKKYGINIIVSEKKIVNILNDKN